MGSDRRTEQSSSLIQQLLFSHLLVASVGLLMLGMALLATYDLRSTVIHLAQESAPLSQASFQLLTGVRRSLTNLQGWVRSDDQRFLESWQSAWRDQIQPALQVLENFPTVTVDGKHHQPAKELKPLLTALRESQARVQDTVRTPGNEPARLLYLRTVEPITATLYSLLNTLIEDEKTQEGGTERKALLARIGETRHRLATAHLLVRETLDTDGLRYIPLLQETLQALRSQADVLLIDPLLAPNQQQLVSSIAQELKDFTGTTAQLTQLRQSADWNIALRAMSEDVVPLADQVIALAEAIAKQAKQQLEAEISTAQSASALTVWVLGLMILAMLVFAYLLSKKRATALAAPITTLVAATRQMATGSLHVDLPPSGNDELDELTRAFNKLRSSMHRTQEKLREANGLLEQRVAERTADLERVNQVLTHEIHNRNQTEIALRESEARLRAMTRAIPDLVFVVDEDGRYREVLAPGQARPISGIPSARDSESDKNIYSESNNYLELSEAQQKTTAIGLTPIRDRLLHEVHSQEMADFFLAIIRNALATRHIQVAEYELRTASGLRWFESRTAPLDVKFNAKAAAIVVSHDITKRKQAETQLRQAQKMQAIGQLTGGIAHDFNNLLAVIMGNLELLHEQLTDEPRLHELAQQALKAVDRGTYLTRRLLAFSRRQPLLAQTTDLNKLVRGMLDLMRRTLGATIQIDTLLADNLAHTLIDPDQLESALLNLVINARDAMPQGGKLTLETANILIEKDYADSQADLESGTYVMLAVKDTGVGMPPKVLERAFEPFFTTKETGKGSGFGLSIVYGLIKQSGGHITIHSQINQGTLVRLYLPPIQELAQAVPDPHVAHGATKGHGEIILVVEDDAAVRLFAVNALRGLGYEPIAAADAASALEILETTLNVALLFTDIVMPGPMDGVKLAMEAQRRYPTLPVLYTSGYTEHALIGDGHQVASADVLAKPYRKADLGRNCLLYTSDAADE